MISTATHHLTIISRCSIKRIWDKIFQLNHIFLTKIAKKKYYSYMQSNKLKQFIFLRIILCLTTLQGVFMSCNTTNWGSTCIWHASLSKQLPVGSIKIPTNSITYYSTCIERLWIKNILIFKFELVIKQYKSTDKTYSIT